MASPSSTSSSELGPRERVRPSRVPVAALAFLAAVVAIELTARVHIDWFADLASWQWKTKRELIDQVGLNGDVAIFGTSVLFHGLDPGPANDLGGGRVVNLALNGMSLPQQVQLFEERAASPAPPAVVVLEARDFEVDRKTWIQGPYFRFWASFPEFSESRFYYWEPATALTFGTHRVLTTYQYRQSIDNWLTNSAHEMAPSTMVRDRNGSAVTDMVQHDGMATGTFEHTVISSAQARPRPGDWGIDRTGRIWLERFMAAAAARGIRVTLLVPPAPPFLAAEREVFRVELNTLLQQVRRDHPRLQIEVFDAPDQGLDRFADSVHLNGKGRAALSAEFAAWLAASELLTQSANRTARDPLSGAEPKSAVKRPRS